LLKAAGCGTGVYQPLVCPDTGLKLGKEGDEFRFNYDNLT
jgi:hypothetical protein